MERCPICRGRLDKVTLLCGRCGANLEWAELAQSNAKIVTKQAVASLLQGHLVQAEHLLVQAQSLEDSPFVRQLLGFIRSENRLQDRCITFFNNTGTEHSLFSR
ncbi:MAG: hypothetical protein GXP08_15005 [Gammaproteobacteria bacterium]|nr:hypothetical protein [Gammaproteobacteria bacterium]